MRRLKNRPKLPNEQGVQKPTTKSAKPTALKQPLPDHTRGTPEIVFDTTPADWNDGAPATAPQIVWMDRHEELSLLSIAGHIKMYRACGDGSVMLDTTENRESIIGAAICGFSSGSQIIKEFQLQPYANLAAPF